MGILISKNMDDAVKINELGMMYYEFGDRENAIKCFRVGVDNYNLPIFKYNLACNLYESGNTSEGKKWFKLAAEENDPDALFYLGCY
jgi:TPR repeat protein